MIIMLIIFDNQNRNNGLLLHISFAQIVIERYSWLFYLFNKLFKEFNFK